MGIDFEPVNQVKADDKFELLPQVAATGNDACALYLTKYFEYVARVKRGRYFAIWGCGKLIGDSVTRESPRYDSGFWVFGSNEDRTNTTVANNAREIISEAILDMKLNGEYIWHNLIINENRFRPNDKLDCSIDRFRNQCSKRNWSYMFSKNKILTFFVLFSVISIVVVIGVGIYCIK